MYVNKRNNFDRDLSRNIRRQRAPKGMTEPTIRQEITIDDARSSTCGGKSFLFSDSKDEKRILKFASADDAKV